MKRTASRTIRNPFAETYGLRVAFPKGVNYAGPVTVFRPNGDGVLAPVPASAVESKPERAVPTHAELNALSRERYNAAIAAKKEG